MLNPEKKHIRPTIGTTFGLALARPVLHALHLAKGEGFVIEVLV
jgi:hypothetical protein